jgi:ATP-dependent RNA helicase SUPV3L1/SUV3
VGWPFSIPKTIVDLVHLEAVFDVLDLYLWFSYRFMDIFPDGNLVRDIQKELDEIIQQGVFQITKLLQNSESATSSNQPDEDALSTSQRKVTISKGKSLPSRSKKVETMQNFSPTDFSKQSPLRGRLTERLLSQGLLTPNMLQELKKEWDHSANTSNQRNASDDDEDDPSPFKKLRRKRTKK